MKVIHLMWVVLVFGIILLPVPPVGVLLLLSLGGFYPYRKNRIKIPKILKGKMVLTVILTILFPYFAIPYFLYKYIIKKRKERRANPQYSSRKDDKISDLSSEIEAKKRELELLEERNRSLEQQKREQQRIEQERPRLRHYNNLLKKKLEVEDQSLESLKIKRLQEEIRRLKGSN